MLQHLHGELSLDEASRDRAAVERFERLADGAAEFLRCVEFNAAPRKRRLLGVGPAVGKLGGGVEYGMLPGAGARHCFLGALDRRARRRSGWEAASLAAVTARGGRPARNCSWCEQWSKHAIGFSQVVRIQITGGSMICLELALPERKIRAQFVELALDGSAGPWSKSGCVPC